MSTSRARVVAVGLFVATVVQLVVAATASNLPQFEDKAFGARLVVYPMLMLLAPVVWWLRRGRPRRGAGAEGQPARPPWDAFAVLMVPFFVDVTGNSLDLFDRVVWWDDALHLVNWFLVCLGLGLVLLPGVVAPRWVVAGLVTGGGALLAVVWELGEWYTFIRQGTELATAYQDTLGDEVLGTTGAALAAVVLLRRRRRADVR